MNNPLKHELLTNDETQALIARYQSTSDPDAARLLLAHNERMIYQIAHRYYRTGATGDAQMDDLMQWGRMGLLRALQSYDTKRGFVFSTYCYWWIRSHILRYGRPDGQSFAVSIQAHDQRATVGKERARFEQQHGREPTTGELEAATGIHNVIRLRSYTVSMDDSRDEDTQSVVDQLASDSDTEDDGGRMADKVNNLKIHKYLGTLPEMWQRVICLRYGFDTGNTRTLAEVSAVMGVTRERIRQIEKDSLAALRDSGIFGEFFAG